MSAAIAPATRAFIQLFTLSFALIFNSSSGAAELPDFTDLVKQNSPAVVNISTRQSSVKSNVLKDIPFPDMPDNAPWGDLFKHFFGDPQGNGQPGHQEARSLGSGVIIDADGYIITNNHVVDGADEVTVRLGDRRELSAVVVGSDERSDIALLKIDGHDLPIAKIGRSAELNVGEWVMAIGSPFGFDHSVSVGVVSALGRSLPNESYVPFIQTDVAINPGNSGGPLFNLDGKVVGINSQIYSRTGGYMGLSFAIPIDVAMEVVQQLKSKGHVSRGWLGVLIQDVNAELADSFGLDKPTGALVAKVLPDSPAQEGGFEVGDVILALQGEPISYSSDLPPMVGRLGVGSTATFEVLRAGKQITLTITLGELPSQVATDGSRSKGPVSRGDIASLGLSAQELSPQQYEEHALDHGVLITQVGDGAAADAGIQRGDIILKLNGQDVANLNGLRELVKALPAGKTVSVLVQRESGPLFLALRVPAAH